MDGKDFFWSFLPKYKSIKYPLKLTYTVEIKREIIFVMIF